MSSKPRLRAALACAAVLGTALVLGAALWFGRDRTEPPPELRELTRDQLELHDGVLRVKGESEPFDGIVRELYPGHAPRTELTIRAGRPHGRARGWYDNGQLEVEEQFVAGTSHGVRTRWHSNGAKKSEAHIVDGSIEGVFKRWHDNGQLAATAEMQEGVPHGVSMAWDRDGRLTARVVLEGGEVVSKEYWEGGDA